MPNPTPASANEIVIIVNVSTDTNATTSVTDIERVLTEYFDELFVDSEYVLEVEVISNTDELQLRVTVTPIGITADTVNVDTVH